jgi:hypothetical protein
VSKLRGGYRHSRGGDPDEPGRGAELPDARTSLRGLTGEGDEAWLARAISQKLYRCPGCHREVPIGADHVVVHFVRRAGGSDHHHWHRECVAELLVPTLRSLRRVTAAEATGDRLRERGRRPAGRRRRS